MTPDHIQQLDRLLVAAPRMQLYAEILKSGGVVQFRHENALPKVNDEWQDLKYPSAILHITDFLYFEIRRKPEPERRWLSFNESGVCIAASDTPESASYICAGVPGMTVREFVEVVK